MKRNIRMDDLLDKSEPFASFHDAALHKVQLDYDARVVSAEFELYVDNPEGKKDEEKERTRRGILTLEGLAVWAIDSPGNDDIKRWGPLRLTHDCLLEESSTETGTRLSSLLGTDMFAWCMFFSNTNSFGYCAAKEASFKWKDGGAVLTK
jgi:hypothetical protein